MKKKNKPEDQEQGTGRRNRHSNSFRDQIIRYLHDEKGFSWPKAELGFHKKCGRSSPRLAGGVGSGCFPKEQYSPGILWLGDLSQTYSTSNGKERREDDQWRRRDAVVGSASGLTEMVVYQGAV